MRLVLVNTQMQLLNAVEYLDLVKGTEAHVYLMAVSERRLKQMEEILELPSYSKVFTKQYKTTFGNNSFINLLKSLVVLFHMLRLVFQYRVDTCIYGYYVKSFNRLMSRLMLWKSAKAEVVLVDDGNATIEHNRLRKQELGSGKPELQYKNRFIKLIMSRNPSNNIPKNLTFFTIYSFEKYEGDRIILNDYSFLKSHLNEFKIPDNVTKADVIFLGEPLYRGIFMTNEVYRGYLKKYAKYIGKTDIIYYAHPAETEKKWRDNCFDEHYIYVENTVSFEVLMKSLRKGCKVVSFPSSCLSNISVINPDLCPQCIKIEKEELVVPERYVNWVECYSTYSSMGIEILVL